MQIIRDEVLIQKRKKIGQITSVLGLLVLFGGMAVYMFGQKMGISMQMIVYIPFIALLLGFILSNIGIYFMNQWGRSPRPDQIIDTNLKGLGKEFKIYHFVMPVPHLMLTPKGLIPLVVKNEPGNYTVDGEKWRQRFSIMRVLRFMGQEGLGNPTREARYQADQVIKYLAKNYSGAEQIPVLPVIVFLAENVNLAAGETEIPVMRAAKLKGYLRSLEGKSLSQQEYKQLEELLDRHAGISS